MGARGRHATAASTSSSGDTHIKTARHMYSTIGSNRSAPGGGISGVRKGNGKTLYYILTNVYLSRPLYILLFNSVVMRTKR